MLQENKAANFASDISLKISICSDTDFNLPIFNIERELSLGGMSIVLPTNILLKKLAWRLKTNTKKRVALFYYIYTLINKEKGYL